jgi:3-oxoacyl-[acyl-carrier-protein] synthase-3
MAIGLERGFVRSGENVAMLGIGSGINCLMAGVEWQTTLASGHNVHSKPETVAGS